MEHDLILIFISLFSAGAGVTMFLWNAFEKTDARLDLFSIRLTEALTSIENLANHFKELKATILEWRDADRELIHSRLELHWQALQSLKETVEVKK